ncbi:MAG: TlpA family protein disulfide reductase, partial [bacterium]
PCIAELEFLGELDGRLKDLNSSVVGILYDVDDEGAVDAGKALLAERHAEYLNLMPPKGLDEMVRIGGVPTSLLVDQSGTVLVCIVGANTDAYEPVIQNLLPRKTASGSPS